MPPAAAIITSALIRIRINAAAEVLVADHIVRAAFLDAIVGVDGAATAVDAFFLIAASAIRRTFSRSTLLFIADHVILTVRVLAAEVILLNGRLTATGQATKRWITIFIITTVWIGISLPSHTNVLHRVADVTVGTVLILPTALKTSTTFVVVARTHGVTTAQAWAGRRCNAGRKNSKAKKAPSETEAQHSILRNDVDRAHRLACPAMGCQSSPRLKRPARCPGKLRASAEAARHCSWGRQTR